MTIPMGMSVWRVKSSVTSILSSLLIPATADVVLITRPASTTQIPHTKPRRLYLGDVLNDDPSPPFAPAGQIRTEEYVIPLLIDCVAFTSNSLDGAEVAMSRMAAMVAAIELQILNDQSWGATCTNSGLALAMEATGPLGDGPGGGSGWRSSAIFDLHVQRRGA